ncbi:alpha/beta fold hydrolase [Pseudomonas profundi]|uniref:alpha/beta fold hydrolase n=1 Tax=Pseudomonas profundi TaxID=1981513 RepID=UPI001239F505|nr:alpha/beta hydrolase [Pseudomonas profundi]
MPDPNSSDLPVSRFYSSRSLRLHYLDWGNPDAPLLVLLHGGLEHARVWDQVALQLREQWHVVVPDLRGHGDSDWSTGCAYSIPDYVPDIAALMEDLGNPPATLVAHSLGGNIAIHYTAAFPEQVERLCVIEGLGSSPKVRAERDLTPRHGQLRAWVEKVGKIDKQQTSRYANIEAAVDRLMSHDPLVDRATALHICSHGLTAAEDGQLRWKYDAKIRGGGAAEVASPEASDLWQTIECPVLLIYGEESWASNPEKDGRSRHFPNARIISVEGAGHNVHHHRPAAFMECLMDFLAQR